MILSFWLYIIILLIVLALIEYYNKNIEMLYTDSFNWCYYLVFVEVMIDNKEQILILKIKSNRQYLKY